MTATGIRVIALDPEPVLRLVAGAPAVVCAPTGRPTLPWPHAPVAAPPSRTTGTLAHGEHVLVVDDAAAWAEVEPPRWPVRYGPTVVLWRPGPAGAELLAGADAIWTADGAFRRHGPGDVPAPLGHHGDREPEAPQQVGELAVNVLPTPPAVAAALRRVATAAATYPSTEELRAALAARWGRPPEQCTLLNGAAEGLWALAASTDTRLAVCVHPTFTAGEAALRTHRIPVLRALRQPDDWHLPALPDAADLVLITRPDNPTGVTDPIAAVAALCRPGRLVVVDESFAEFLADEDTLAPRSDLPGLVVLRSATKLWGAAGIRAGYLLGPPQLVAAVDRVRQPWPVNVGALALLAATLEQDDVRAAQVARTARRREALVQALSRLPGVRVWPSPANFLLLRLPCADAAARLRRVGLRVRDARSFPGLDDRYVRLAVTDVDPDEIATRIACALGAHHHPRATHDGGR